MSAEEVIGKRIRRPPAKLADALPLEVETTSRRPGPKKRLGVAKKKQRSSLAKKGNAKTKKRVTIKVPAMVRSISKSPPFEGEHDEEDEDLDEESAEELEPWRPRPGFKFLSLGEMARKLLKDIQSKPATLSNRKHRAAYCAACLEFVPKTRSCAPQHDNNQQRLQEMWLKEFPRTNMSSLDKETVINELQFIADKYV